MKKLSSRVMGAALSVVLATGCVVTEAQVLTTPQSAEVQTWNGPGDPPLVPASKVDLLLVVDNSNGMKDKSQKLSTSIKGLLQSVAKVGDVHVGVITTSLGGQGGDVCDERRNPKLNERAHLRNTDENGVVVVGAESGVLSYLAGASATTGAPNLDVFADRVASVVRGVGESGCGFEAQLEAMHRFLVEPKPAMNVRISDSRTAELEGLDTDVLAQRKLFLRPDSALVIVMVSDEDDGSLNPMSLNGQGWAFASSEFPGSMVRRGPGNDTTAPKPTTACASNPASEACTSCGISCDPTKPECQQAKQDANCNASPVPGRTGFGYDGYYAPAEDGLNVRFHRMKERFGVDPLFPIQRYIDGLTSATAPGDGGCRNPIFAASLPDAAAGDDVCTRPRGMRSTELVLFTVIGGLPPALASATPDWTLLLGANPEQYDLTGIDPHMIPSIAPRFGLPSPLSPATDPVHGREWDTKGDELQFACRFPLPVPRTCAAGDLACECEPSRGVESPVCRAAGIQEFSKAYPTPRLLRVAKGLGERGIVGSVCATDDYASTMTLLASRLSSRLVP
jgi:hypothetical protein